MVIFCFPCFGSSILSFTRKYYLFLDSKMVGLSWDRFLLTRLFLMVISFVSYRGTYVLT